MTTTDLTIERQQTEAARIEAAGIEAEQAICASIRDLERERRDVASKRRAAEVATDFEASRPFREDHAARAAQVAERTQDRDEKVAHKKSLGDRLDAGDATVTEEELTAAETSVVRAERLIPSALRELKTAERALRPLLTDNDCAYLAAELMRPLISAPPVVHKRAGDAPNTSPMVVLSQTTPTRDNGTIEASGEVGVTVVGDVDIDWPAVQRALEGTGSEVSASESSIVFRRAAWPIPRLASPDGRAVAVFANLFERAWADRIERNLKAEYLAQHGYVIPQGAFGTGLTALSRVLDTTLTADDGTAIGTATFRLSVERGGMGSSFNVSNVQAEAEGLTEKIRTQWVGRTTEAGEVVSLELTSAEKSDGSEWGRATTDAYGYPRYPATIDVEVQIQFAYQQASPYVVND
jgi:hypothetical protein